MPDNELRLRENVLDDETRHDSAFVIGGGRESLSAEDLEWGAPYWVGGRVVMSFGVDETYYPTEGEPPSPDDARRIERAWNCFDELVAAVHALVDLTERSCPNCEGSIEAYERGKAILAKAQPEGVPSLSRPGVHQGQTPKK